MIFDIVKGQPIIRPESLTIPELKKIWENAASMDIAHYKLCYIYHIADPKSPYSKLADEDREREVKKDFVKGFVIDKELKEAIEKYKELNTSVISRSFSSIKNAINAVNKYLDKTSKTMNDENIDKIRNAMKDMEKFAIVYNNLKDMADKDIEEIGKYKSNVTPSEILIEDDDDEWE